MRTWLRGKMTLLFMTFALLLAIPAIALADIVYNNVVTDGNDTITAGGSTTITYGIAVQNAQQEGGTANGGLGGCNADATTPAKIYINAPGAVTISGSDVKTDASDPNNPKKYVEFTACSDQGPEASRQTKAVTFSSSTVDNHNITHQIVDAGPGNYTNNANFTLKVRSAPVTDNTPPVITPDVDGTLGNNGWYKSDVNVSWSVVDDESTISSSSGCDPTIISTDTTGQTLTCTATSAGGTSSESVTIKRDATKPTLSPTVNPNPVLLNGSATASANASDVMSGVASQSCDDVDTSSVGNKSVSCTATDNAGNTNTASANYSVNYKFVGFSSPVDNPKYLNVLKAGQAVPFKWQLLDANDVPVTNLAGVTVKATDTNCSLGTTADLLEETAAGSSGLQNLGGGYYQYNWKSPTSYAKSCKTLTLSATGLNKEALFQFNK